MDDDPNDSLVGRTHATVVNWLMRHVGLDVDGSIVFAWQLAKQLANGNVSCCIFVFMNVLSCDIDYYLRFTQPREDDPAISFFGLVTLLVSHVLLVSMAYYNLIIRSSLTPKLRNISGWILTHSYVTNFFFLYEVFVHGYVGGSFNSIKMGLLISVILLFEAFVFMSLRKLLRSRMRRHNPPPIDYKRLIEN